MTLLALIQYVCRRTALPNPSSVYGNADEQIKQMMGLLEEEGNDLNKRGNWERTTFEASLTTLAVEDQGAITSIATNAFDYIINDTMWDRTSKLPVIGPESSQDWQALKAVVTTGPRYRMRIRGGHLLVNPAPPASDAWYFEYHSENWILQVDGTTYLQYFGADTDVPLLPASLLIMGLRWRWKKEKGLSYAEDFATYEMQVKNALGRDGGKKVLYQDGCGSRGPEPGIWVPGGSWLQ